MELKNKKINFLGDSITEGAGTTGPEYRYDSLLCKREGAIGRNYGISGTRIARQIAQSVEPRWDGDFCARALQMDPDADIVVVFGGTNDFGHGDAPLGTMSDRTPETFYGAMHTLCIELVERYPDAAIVFLTPLHRLTEDNPRGDNKPADVGTLQTYVNIMREVLEYYSMPVLDLFAESGLQPKIPVIQERFMPDGLHPSNAGNEIIAQKLTQFLKYRL